LSLDSAIFGGFVDGEGFYEPNQDSIRGRYLLATIETRSGVRKFGLSPVGDVPWGTHLCQFYQTKEDLIDILVPYFKAGLKSNEFCMWITAEPLNKKDAEEAMEKAMPNFSRYVENGQIEIISYKDWYVKGGVFDCDRVLKGWVSKLEEALKKGYAGLRLTGNTFWLEKKDWLAFTNYEEAVNDVIGKYKMIAVCTYSLDKCNANEIIDVIRNHQFALVKRSGMWELIESSERKKIAEELLKTEQKFAALYDSMTEGVALHEVVYDACGNAIDYVIMDVNPAFEKITGLSKKQSAGKKASELYETGAPPYLDIYAKVAESGKPASFETYFPPMQKHFNISVFSPSKGKFNTIFYDVTDRKLAEAALRTSEQRWVTTLRSIGDAVIATDVEGRITFMNRIAERLTGWASTDASGKPLKDVFNIVNEVTRKEVGNPVAKVLEKGLIVGLANHTLLICRDGTEIPIDDSGAPIRDASGKITGVVLVFRDITERRRMEAELNNLAKFPSENPNAVLRFALDGTLMYSNRASKSMLEELLGSIQKLPEQWHRYLTEALSSGKKKSFEEQVNGLTYRFVAVPVISEGYVNIYGEDITERKRAEQELLETRDYLENLLNYANAPIIVWDPDFCITKFNRAFERLTGISSRNAVGKSLGILFPEDMKEQSMAYIKRTLEGEYWESVEIPVQNVDGTVKTLLWNSANICDSSGKQIVATIAQGHDITERKKAEEILREQGLIITSASDAIFSTDNSFIIKSWNKAAEHIFGWTAQEVIGKASNSIFNPVYPTLEGTTREQAIEQLTHAGIWKGEIMYHRKDGSPIPVSASANLVKDKSGGVVGTVAIVHDITARKRREDALRDAQRDLNRAQAVAKTGSWRLDTRLNILSWSDEAYHMFGLPKGTPLTYEIFLSRVHPEDVKYVNVKWNAALHGEPYDIEHRIIVNGETKWVREKGELEFDEDKNLLGGFGTVQDITEQKKMQEKLEESAAQLEEYANQMEHLAKERAEKLKDAERLAAIGATAGMVGHDIRNPLQAIVGELYLAKGNLLSLSEGECKESLEETIATIEEQVGYINKIVTDLQDFAKPLLPCMEETSLQSLIRSVLPMMNIPETVKVELILNEQLPNFRSDAAYIKRVITNLISNAIQAMLKGGKLTIRTCQENTSAILMVEDTGVGISLEARSKLFQPLFTTKSKGQGFGLAVCKRLVEALNGTITFESEMDKGTKFIVKLPTIY
jgi:PAS domain S-box-containing protein